MTGIDIACIVFIVLWLFVGMKKGFLHGILRIAVMVGCLIAAYLLHPYIRDLLANFFNYGPRLDKIVFAGIFFTINISFNSIAGRFLDTLGSSNALSAGNRFAGAFLGGVQGLVYAAAFLMILSSAVSPDAKLKKQIDDSKIAGTIQKTIVISYGSLDKLIRKSGMNPLINDIESLFKP